MIFDRSITLQYPISTKDLVDAILEGLSGLNSPYREFCRSLKAHMTSMSFDDLFGLFLIEERKLHKDKSPVEDLNHILA